MFSTYSIASEVNQVLKHLIKDVEVSPEKIHTIRLEMTFGSCSVPFIFVEYEPGACKGEAVLIDDYAQFESIEPGQPLKVKSQLREKCAKTMSRTLKKHGFVVNTPFIGDNNVVFTFE